MNNIDRSVFIAEGARIAGDGITIGAGSSVWYNAVIRCEGIEKIEIGEKTNVQDLCVMHCGTGASVRIGDRVTIGHMALIHGCEIGSDTLIGMGSTIMNNAVIGSNCIIGAGSLVTEGKVIPDGVLAFGRPAKVVRELTDEEKASNIAAAEYYLREAAARMRQEN